MKVAGIVLCGGDSKRMGRSKAWVEFGNETLLQRVVGKVRAVVDPVVVVAAAGQELPTLPDGVLRVNDAEPGRGPLQGLATGLAALGADADAAFLCGCDSPFIEAEFVRLLVDRLGDSDACVPFVAGRLHPLAAVYRTRVLDVARELLAQGSKGPVHLLGQVSRIEVQEAELAGKLHSLRNVNTPEELAQAAREWDESL